MDIEEKIAGICSPVLASAGMELVLVEVSGLPRRRTVRLYVDRPDGVNVEDCARASRLVDQLIDASGVLNASWVLEVSSPGLDRPLVKPADYERFAGRKVKIRLKRPLENRRNLTGILCGVGADGMVKVQIEGGEEVGAPLNDIARANLVFEWK